MCVAGGLAVGVCVGSVHAQQAESHDRPDGVLQFSSVDLSLGVLRSIQWSHVNNPDYPNNPDKNTSKP